MKKISPFLVQDLQALGDFVRQYREIFCAGHIILLSGEVGAGKTELVKTIVQVLQQNASAKSPTFALHHHYPGLPLIDHWDLYRIENAEDLESTGFWDQFQSPDSLILVEWPERMPLEYLPSHWPVFHLQIQCAEGKARLIKQL